MRIIAGDAHGRRMTAPRGFSTRPATARVRQSIFSRLDARMELDGSRVLDLFAGSGSLGIEALSRGAAHAVFVDSSRHASDAIQRNLRQLGLAMRTEMLHMDIFRALSALAGRGERFDLVFVDPPYADDRSAEALARISELNLMTDGAFAVVRQSSRAPEINPPDFATVRTATVGDHRIALYRRGTGTALSAADG
ncbi:MAG: 16S rRNA (guanine(966)-N(2))-methyltransferase RsmD [Candidatus Binataceae bacterium]